MCYIAIMTSQSQLEPEVLKTYMPKSNGKLNRDRGLGWEDELTSELSQSRYMYCYNLGGSTHHIPDIFIMADSYSHGAGTKQLTIDQELYKVKDKLITGPFVMAVECKYSTVDRILIPKEEVDKCFEFITQLSRYQRFVLLAFKFKNGSKPIKHFVLIDYDDLYINVNYDFFMMTRDGVGNFYMKGINQHKPPKPHGLIGCTSMCVTKTRVQHGSFNLDSA